MCVCVCVCVCGQQGDERPFDFIGGRTIVKNTCEMRPNMPNLIAFPEHIKKNNRHFGVGKELFCREENKGFSSEFQQQQIREVKRKAIQLESSAGIRVLFYMYLWASGPCI